MSALKICPTCSTEYPANERFCPRDGSALHSQSSGNDLVGSILAERYHVLKLLGEGGMGQVYLAEHVKMGRRSAVKVMHPSMVQNADAIGRFNREAANASRINHPNVAGIYDFGETSDGLVYLAMEFIEGQTLTDLLKEEGALPPVRAAEITRQTAEALNVAHDMGIVHRDLKPDNIMITKDHDGEDRVKVVDFGIAKAIDSEGQNMTRTGMVVGTPEYMSPEQLSGDTIDGRSDIYSLGLVAFNMLTGKLPFPSDTAQSAMIMRLTERPRPLAEMKADVRWREEMQVVMDKVLERDTTKRYQKAREFGRALVDAARLMPAGRSLHAGTMVMTPPESAPAMPSGNEASKRRMNERSRSRAPMLISGVLVAAAIAAAVIYMPGGKENPAATTTPAPTDTATATGAAGIASAATPDVAPTARLPFTPDSIPHLAVSSAASVPSVVDTVASSSAPPVAVPPSTSSPIAATTPQGEAARRSLADSAALAADLRMALLHASDESTARKALSEADRIAAKTTLPEERALVQMIRAQAYGTLGQDGRSCQALRDGVALAKGTSVEPRLAGGLARCR